MNSVKQQFKQKIARGQIILMILIVIAALCSVTAVFAQEETGPQKVITKEVADISIFGMIAAAAAFGLGAIGTGIAIASIGSAAMGAIGERPEIATKALMFVALADGILIFGFITALLILGKVPL